MCAQLSELKGALRSVVLVGVSCASEALIMGIELDDRVIFSISYVL